MPARRPRAPRPWGSGRRRLRTAGVALGATLIRSGGELSRTLYLPTLRHRRGGWCGDRRRGALGKRLAPSLAQSKPHAACGG